LAAYTSTTDPLYYTLRFIDGLREDIKSIVLVQRPPDLDIACVLAALQEEVGDSSRQCEFKRSESGYMSKSTSKNPLPLSAPPDRDKQGNSLLADDRRGTESTRTASSLESKAAALRSYRRAMGLCYKCNERWSREHKCSPTVQLHVVQKLWELFQLDDDGNGYPTSQCSEPPTDLLLLAIPKAAVMGFPAPRTVKLVGSIQNKVISVLVDSGSTSSFIRSIVAAHLTVVTPLPSPSSVQVAGGGILCCNSVIKNVVWVVFGYSFQSELRVLLLAAYDVIIGMDWLEQHSPMKVHWKENGWRFLIMVRLLYFEAKLLHQQIKCCYRSASQLMMGQLRALFLCYLRRFSYWFHSLVRSLKSPPAFHHLDHVTMKYH
jgi:hypothetical protein